MTWLYQQNSGRLYNSAGDFVAAGYAGGDCGLHPEGRNNPEMQDQRDIGPLPCGMYTFGEPIEHLKLGPYALPLIPDPDNVMFGRTDFFMHGDNIERPGRASDGCLVMPRNVRQYCWTSPDHRLQVVSGINQSLEDTA